VAGWAAQARPRARRRRRFHTTHHAWGITYMYCSHLLACTLEKVHCMAPLRVRTDVQLYRITYNGLRLYGT
jgi:hypothetical protein